MWHRLRGQEILPSPSQLLSVSDRCWISFEGEQGAHVA